MDFARLFWWRQYFFEFSAFLTPSQPPIMVKQNRLTLYILIAMVLGVLVGYIVHRTAEADWLNSFATNIKLLTTIFLRMVQMIIAPLVFSTLVVGIAKLGDLKTVGRVGGKAMLWFITASLVSLLIGMVLVNFFQPGAAIDLSNADSSGAQDLMGKTKVFSLSNFVEHVFPRSVVEAMATNEILQLVVFSIFFGIAATSIGSYAKPVIKALEGVSHIILKMVNYVMAFAPLGVFGAISAVIAVKGLEVFKFYGLYLQHLVYCFLDISLQEMQLVDIWVSCQDRFKGLLCEVMYFNVFHLFFQTAYNRSS